MFAASPYFATALLVLLLGTVIKGQSDTIMGQLLGANRSSIAGGTIILLKAVDSSFVSYTLTGEDGRFTLTGERTDTLLLKATSIGYESTIFVLQEQTWSLPLLTVELTARTENLIEITVTDKAPVRQSGDTLLYRGTAYRDSTERKVGDLLRKIPGIDVDVNGDVKVRGRPIRTMLIDGDDISAGSYQVLTNQLGANVVEDVEVIFHYFENPLLGEVFESEAIAVNLKTATSKQRKANGSVSVGAGTNGRYDLEGSLVALYDRFKTVSFIQRGNIGTPLQNISTSVVPVTDFPAIGLLRPDQNALVPENLLSGPVDPTRINTTGLFSTNAHLKLKNNWKLNATAQLPYEDYRLESATYFDYRDSTPDRILRVTTVGDIQRRCFTLKATKDYPRKARLTLAANAYRSRRGTATDFGEEELFERSLRTYNESFTANLTAKVFPGSIGVLEVNYYRSKQDQGVMILDEEAGVSLPATELPSAQVTQSVNYNPYSLSVSGKVLRKSALGKWLIDLTYLNRRVDLMSLTKGDTEVFQFREVIARSELSGKVQYVFEASKRASWLLSAQAGHVFRIATGLNNPEQTPYLLSNLRYRLKWSLLKELSGLYSYSTETSTELQLADFTSYLSRYEARRGNPMLGDRIAAGHRLDLTYRTGSIYPHYAFGADASLSYQAEFQVLNYEVRDRITFVNPLNRRQSRPGYSLNSYLEKFIAPVSSTAIVSVGYRKRSYQASFRDEVRNISGELLSMKISVKTGLDLPVNLLMGVEQTFSSTEIRTGDLITYNSRRLVPFVDLLFSLPAKMSGKFSNNWMISKSDAVTARNLISDLELSYQASGFVSRVGGSYRNVFNARSVDAFQTLDFVQITNSSRILAPFLLIFVEFNF